MASRSGNVGCQSWGCVMSYLLKRAIVLNEIRAGRDTSRKISHVTGLTLCQIHSALSVLSRHGRVERAGRVATPRGQPLVRWRALPSPSPRAPELASLPFPNGEGFAH
jgi:hypothetical protein